MGKLRKIKKYKIFWAVLAVFLTVVVAYGQTLQMYFWQDDSALIFKLQNPQGPAGSYGEGIIGNGPYKYLITLFVPFFPIFQLNPFWYFLVGLIAYCIATGVFYLFAAELLKSKKASFFSTIVYAAGFIGSDTMLRISNSWQTNLGLILALLSFWAYIKFFRNNYQYRYYLAALFFFYSAVEFVFIRSHSLILPVLAIELSFLAASWQAAKIPMILIRQFPFWYIFYSRYLINRSEGGLGLAGLVNNLLSGKVEVLSAFFATVGNTIVPVAWQVKFAASVPTHTQLVLWLLVVLFNLLLHSVIRSDRKSRIFSTTLLLATYFLNRFFINSGSFWYRSQLDFMAGGLGLYVVVIVLGLSAVLWKAKRTLAIALILGLVILMSQIFGYFIKYPEAVLTTTHRYLSYAFVGYSIIVGATCFLLFEGILKKWPAGKKFAYFLAVIPLGLVLTSNLYLGVTYQNQVVKDISQPTRYFYTTLKQFVLTAKKGDVFYFDIEDNSFYKSQFGNFFSVGSMPDSTALAIYYNVDRYDIFLVNDFNELLYKLSKGEIEVDNINSFYFGRVQTDQKNEVHFGSSGLVDTSTTLRALLKAGSSPKALSSEKKSTSSVILSDLTLLPLTSLLLTIEAKITPDLDNIVFTKQQPQSSLTSEQKMKMVSFLLSRQDYYRKVKPLSLSQWKFQEVAQLTDNDLNTSWRAHRIYWHENRHEELTVNLGQLKSISSVIWTNWRHISTPTSYTIDVSADGKIWKTVREVEGGSEKKDGESVREYFDNEIAQFVRMSINKTLSGEEPALTEFEVVESVYQDIGLPQALAFINSPPSFSSKEDLEQFLSQAAPLLNLKVTWETDKGRGEKELPIDAFGMIKRYEFILDAGGTTLNNITISTPSIAAKINIESTNLQNLSLSNIENRKLIKNLSEN